MNRTVASTAFRWANRSHIVFSKPQGAAAAAAWKSVRVSKGLFSTTASSPPPPLPPVATMAEDAPTTTAATTTKAKKTRKAKKESTAAASDKVTKATITSVVAEKHSLSLAEAARIMDTVTDSIIDALKEKKEVNITGFGKFQAVLKKAGEARNPSTQAKILVPEKTRVRFAAFESLKDVLNEKK